MTASRAIPLRYLLRPREVANRPDLPVLSVYRDHGVVLKDSRSDNFNTTPADLSRYQVVRPGDLVVNKMKAWQGSLAVSHHLGIVSPDYLVCSVSPDVYADYLHFLLRSAPLVAEYHKLSKGIRPAQWRLYWEELATIRVNIPEIGDQWRIADFLDVQVSRAGTIDRKVAEGLSLLEERRLAVIDSAMTDVAVDGFVPVKYLSQIVDTEHKTAPHVTSGGYWIAGTQAVRQGRLVVSKLYETDEESYRGWTRRATPKPGDVLLSREAPVGEVALYGKSDPPIAIGQRMVLIRPAPRKLDPKFLMWGLLSGRTREYVKLKTQGSLHPHLNMSDIGGIPIPIVSADRQSKVADEISAKVARLEAMASAYRRMRGLVSERRQAMIAAAVTGRLDVATAQGVDA